MGTQILWKVFKCLEIDKKNIIITHIVRNIVEQRPALENISADGVV